MLIRDAALQDAAAIAAIYNPYVLNTTISFEETAVSPDEMAQRIDHIQQQGLPYLVLEADGQVQGYAYATPWRVRKAYRFSVEVTVYLRSQVHGQGFGTALYQELFTRLKALGVHAVIGGITQPNPGSVALHEKLGMRQVALFPEVGFKFGAWRDVGYWQLNFIDSAASSEVVALPAVAVE